jgi:hypothetical protein
MYAVVRRYTLKPGGARLLAGRVEREFVPILRSVPGFVSYQLLEGGTENGRDVLATFSIFSSKEGAEESVRRAADWVGANLGDFEPSKPSVAAGEILVSSESQTPTAPVTAFVR